MQKIKNQITVKFGDICSTDYKHSMKVNRNMTLIDLKKLISPKKNRRPSYRRI